MAIHCNRQRGCSQIHLTRDFSHAPCTCDHTHMVAQGVSGAQSRYPHAIRHVICLSMRCLSWLCLPSLYLSPLPFLFHCLPVLCGRSVLCQRARLLNWRRRRVCLPGRCPHGRWGSGQSTGTSEKRRARFRRDTRKRTKRGTEKQQTVNRSPWMVWGWYECALHGHIQWLVLSHVVWLCIIKHVHCAGEKWRVRWVLWPAHQLPQCRHRRGLKKPLHSRTTRSIAP